MPLRFLPKRHWQRPLALWLAGAAAFLSAWAELIPIPNGSFESPSISFVSTNFAAWRKTPKPPTYDETGGFFWDDLTGVFANTPPGATGHIDNCDGAQALWLFAVPEVGLFQDYDTVDSGHTEPTHAFDATFLPGNAYQLDFGAIGGGGNMREGVPLEAALYYRDTSKEQITVARTNVAFSRENFPNRTHLTELSLRVPPVKTNDPWAGAHIGIRFLSTVSAEQQGGYWDLDNVRLTSITPPNFTVSVQRTDSSLRLTWPSLIDYTYQVSQSADLQKWSNQGQPQPGTGSALVRLLPLIDHDQIFIRVLAVPAT